MVKPSAHPPVTPQFGSFREMLQFYLIDCRTPLGKLIDIVIILLNLFICVLFVAETYPLAQRTRHILWQLEIATVSIFILEYAARLYGAPDRLRQMVDIYSLIDLIAILPTISLLLLPLFGLAPDLGFMRILRGIRVFRIFRFLRFTADPDFFFGSLNRHFLTVLRLVMTILLIFFISAGLFYQVESDLNPAVHNFGDAFYFTVVALTTVGFGDITPLSAAGKWITVLMILSGIILIPWQASLIVKEWIHMAQKKEIACPNCGLRYHDPDASHCKSCGHVIYQEYDGG
jgi:voltage-gated potassium channel